MANESFDMFSRRPPPSDRVATIMRECAQPPELVMAALMTQLVSKAVTMAARIAIARGDKEVGPELMLDATKHTIMTFFDDDDALEKDLRGVMEALEDDTDTESESEGEEDEIADAAEDMLTVAEEIAEEALDEPCNPEQLEKDVQASNEKWETWEPEDPILVSLKNTFVQSVQRGMPVADAF